MTELPKTYKPADVEPSILERWNSARAFHAEPADSPAKPPYCVLIPPPNVTAALHMGHALNNTLQDILIRWRRMCGDNAVWIPGTDHAGIATQTVVEKRVLAEQGKKRTDFQREDFIKLIQAWKDEYEATITNQLKTMGCSCDWDRQRFTMDPGCAKAVREAFFRLFKDGLIYRGKRLVNWDPATQTALADDEVEMEEIDGHFYYLRYPLADGSGHVTVATTRPETMLGDTAVAVNPKDPRAPGLRGKKVRLPIVNRVVPIIEDDYVVLSVAHGGPRDDVKAQFATGFLKVTPAHDDNDYLLGQRHNLPLINVLAPDATISKDHGWPAEEWGPPSRDNPSRDRTRIEGVEPLADARGSAVDAFAHELLGKDRFIARKMVVKWFDAHGLLEDKKPYRHSVGHSYRSHVPIEPYLSDQWYVKVTDPRLAGAALRAMADGQKNPSPSESASARERVAADLRGSRPGEGTSGTGDRPSTQIPSPGFAANAAQPPSPGRPDFIGTGRGGSPAAWEGQLHFYPERYAKVFQAWHENIRDWCISRQLWWGHRIPVWSGQLQNDTLFEWRTRDWLKDRLAERIDGSKWYLCVRDERDIELVKALEAEGFQQDPDVLDTWFSSALWPISTLGWPEATTELKTWNPSHTLSTAREIITLWVSRMVMFNLYFRDCLPFTEVFIHAMIQDGHGQKMSKSLGNGVDPLDIIHGHGSDAMRFTLAKMTTNTQDVRLPVDLVCPHHHDETITPKTIVGHGGYSVAAPIQHCTRDPKLKMVSSYGLASGQATPTADMPLARNTSERFDEGRNFTNKLWNAVRFALANLEPSAPSPSEPPSAASGGASARERVAEPPEGARPGEGAPDGIRRVGDTSRAISVVPSPRPSPGRGEDAAGRGGQTLSDRWILSRLAAAVREADAALSAYEFSSYAQGLYDFIWRDLCDWYIEAVKPTVKADPAQRQVLATCIDVTLRLLHPVMPFVTERLWEALNEVAPVRSAAGLTLPPSKLLILAAWPKVEPSLADAESEADFQFLQDLVRTIRDVRAHHKAPSSKQLEARFLLAPTASKLRQAEEVLTATNLMLITRLTGVILTRVQTRITGSIEVPFQQTVSLFFTELSSGDAEKSRLTKRLEELGKSIQTLENRLGNKSYTDKAPPHLVQQTRDQLAAAQKEAETLRQQQATPR